MNYLHSDLGQIPGGSVVEVTLRGNAANVLLLDTINLARYRQDAGYSYHGGHYTHSPARIQVPHSGHWHVVVDLGGRGGQVNASINVLTAH
ncbi:MAG TPA: DUF1883 domain-containing protein [Nitrospira sp.]|nr:DUF1883 domain-containing protein [Nitrospira sp.]